MFVDLEEERQRLITVVEYVEESMSGDLLSKFPDNSAFDFDYTQSSIWSPLLPRSYPYPYSPSPLSLGGGSVSIDITPRKLSYGGLGLLDKTIFKNVTTNLKKKITNLKKINRNKNKKASATPPIKKGTSITPTTTTKGWTKVLRAASKHFKKKKKKDPTVHIKRSNYLSRDVNF